jgi:hypothetical protein
MMMMMCVNIFEFPLMALPGMGYLWIRGEDEKEPDRVVYLAATQHLGCVT